MIEKPKEITKEQWISVFNNFLKKVSARWNIPYIEESTLDKRKSTEHR